MKKTTFNEEILKSYSTNNKENIDELLKKAFKLFKKAGMVITHLVFVLYYTLKDDSVPLNIKSIIIGSLAYLVLPLDLIPDFIPVVGYTDDLSALIGAISLSLMYISEENDRKAQAQVRRIFETDYEISFKDYL